MGNAAFPKHISQERRLLRSSPKQPGAPQPGCGSAGTCHTCWHRQGIAGPSSSPGRNLWWSRHCREWDAPGASLSTGVKVGEGNSWEAGAALGRIWRGFDPVSAFLAEVQAGWLYLAPRKASKVPGQVIPTQVKPPGWESGGLHKEWCHWCHSAARTP